MTTGEWVEFNAPLDTKQVISEAENDDDDDDDEVFAIVLRIAPQVIRVHNARSSAR